MNSEYARSGNLPVPTKAPRASAAIRCQGFVIAAQTTISSSTVDGHRFAIDWATDVGQLAALEPTLQEVAARASQLAVGYNEPRNAKLMGHLEPISEFEVVDHYEAMFDDGAR